MAHEIRREFYYPVRLRSMFTDREWEVTRYLAQGFTVPQAARVMGLSKRTVETHWRNVRGKLGIRGTYHRYQLVWWLHEGGFIEYRW